MRTPEKILPNDVKQPGLGLQNADLDQRTEAPVKERCSKACSTGLGTRHPHTLSPAPPGAGCFTSTVMRLGKSNTMPAGNQHVHLKMPTDLCFEP